MVLGERLSAVASFVKNGAKVADIGTDHAKIPIYLAKNNKISFAVASDKNEGPLAFAKKNVSSFGLEKNIKIVRGDGLESLKIGEVDTIIIAGMGGRLITEILSNSPQILTKISHLILQPMNEGNILREWLQNNNWKIENEILVKEDNKIYEIISVVQGKMQELNSVELLLGPIILNNKNEILKERLNNTIGKTKQKILGMEKSNNEINSQNYFYEKNKLKSLEELLW